MFMRTWCQCEFEAHGLRSHGYSQAFGEYTERHPAWAHYQSAPHEEVKLVRCTAGTIYDVIVGLRPASPAYCQHIGITLSADNRPAAYIPKCCAHGFLTLEQNSEGVVLHVDGSCACKRSRFRWGDPAFKIAWPAPILVMSEKDCTWPTFPKSGALLS